MKQIIFLTLTLLLCAISAVAQNAKENLLDKVDVTFYLEGDPNITEVGFDNPKSSWKIDYKLYLADYADLKKINRCGVKEEGASTATCIHTRNQKLDKRIKKFAILISKRKFSNKRLSTDSHRNVTETVRLSPAAIEMFNQAAQSYEKNPVFIFYVKTKISTKNSSGAKLKKAYMTEGLHDLKIYKGDKTFDYWNVSKLSFGTTVIKKDNGTLILQMGFTHFGA